MTNDMIVRAAHFAKLCHAGQTRKYNGYPYITHPIRVAGRTATHDMATSELVSAAFMHDVMEDCGVSCDQIEFMFGNVVAGYVAALTNAPRQEGMLRAERKRLDRYRIALIPKECKVVKMIDRIDNLLELDISNGFAKLYAEESLLLLEVLREADDDLADELKAMAERMLRT